ncbi:hypothetical protein F0U44_09315 [Nocardioides humilatus]|uniref:Uncharacterized protein n=1 Tax=Nocardioides humilatus TaxID=2607660 RepID=A0A5B1LDF7_9ACTN|nr:hypothetical protein [Nocardioides humilatus]KAA1418685.1 hypothetical protein F0U44_09315 [Nocardioides humilatus]
MAIRVVQTDGKTSTHKDAESLSVADGHLFVTDAAGKDLAVYAPGQWITASKAPAGKGAPSA